MLLSHVRLGVSVKVAFFQTGLHAQTKLVNLRTGKPLLDDNFKNLHWPIPPNRNSSCSNRSEVNNDRNDSFRDNVDNFVAFLDEASDWDPVIDTLRNFTR